MVCVVSHDAGGAEILASYVAQRRLDCMFVLEGPAVKVFERRVGFIHLSRLDDAVAKCDWLLCGTSWQSDIEWRALGLGHRCGKRTVAFLDHWGHYRERFIRQGEECFPDEIWVGDELAETRAHECFPGSHITLVPNPYFEDLKRDLAAAGRPQPVAPDHGLNVLFVSEPLREHGLREYGDERHWGYTEEEALRYFMAHLDLLGGSIGRIAIRPHPSEPLDKYDWVRQEYQSSIVNGGIRTLLEEIVESDVVVGFESMAMVVGLLAGKRVISCIPPGGKACALPQSDIEHLQHIAMKP